MTNWRIEVGDCREALATLPERSAHTCVTSPPYFGLRDYGHDGQIGLEPTPDEFVAALVDVFRGVRGVLRDDGTVWLNLGDSYTAGAGSRNGMDSSGLKRNVQDEAERQRCLAENKVYRAQPVAGVSTGVKPKDLLGIPWMVAFALRAEGWYLRSDIIWSKPNPMPESVTDRPTKSHEYVFLLSKSATYAYDADAIREPAEYEGDTRHLRTDTTQAHRLGGGPDESRLRTGNPTSGRNKRSVWTVATQPYAGAHFATFPPKLIEPCVLAGCPEGGTVLDPFAGSGTTGMVAIQHGREFVGIELSPAYAQMARDRISAWERCGFRNPTNGATPAEGQESLFSL